MKNIGSSNYARSLIEASLDPLVTISADGKIMDVNSATEKATGVSRDKLIGSDFSNYFTDPQKARDGYQLAFSQGMVRDYPLAICHVDGRITDVLYNATVYRDEQGNIAGLFAAARDITALKKAQHELEEAILQMQVVREMTDLLQSCQKLDEAYPIIKAALIRLFPESIGGIYIADKLGSTLILADTWGQSELETVFTQDECWAIRRGLVHVALLENSLNPKCDHVKQTTTPYVCIPLLAHGNTLGLIHIQCAPECGNQADMQRKLAIAETAAESARLALANLTLREELRALSIRDPLTGLFNRRFLEEALDRELVRMARAQKMLAVAMLDIDHFKLFNDNHGHDAGDQVLKQTAHLMAGFRKGNDIVCRYGGEEFLIVISEIDPETAIERLEKLRVSIENMPIHLGTLTQQQITISIGVSIYPLHGNHRIDLITRADQALYEAKTSGRNRVVLAK